MAIGQSAVGMVIHMLVDKNIKEALSKEEMDRIDSLLSAARNYHYSAFVLSGISMALSSLEEFTAFRLPIGDIVIPSLQTTVGIYLLVIVLSAASERLWSMAQHWIRFDPRRPPFPWIALGSKRSTIVVWLLLPVLICAISTSIQIRSDDVTGFTLAFLGVIGILLPRSTSDYWNLILSKSDHRGGNATFSIWLLYWYRLFRGIEITTFWFAPVIAIVPNWREPIWDVALPLLIIGTVVYLMRLVAGIPFIYRRIDKLGKVFGFPAESQHYK